MIWTNWCRSISEMILWYDTAYAYWGVWSQQGPLHWYPSIGKHMHTDGWTDTKVTNGQTDVIFTSSNPPLCLHTIRVTISGEFVNVGILWRFAGPVWEVSLARCSHISTMVSCTSWQYRNHKRACQPGAHYWYYQVKTDPRSTYVRCLRVVRRSRVGVRRSSVSLTF